MLEFRDIRLEDKERARECLSCSDFRGCEYTFGNNYIWSKPYNLKVGFYKDFYIVKSEDEFFYPSGKGDIRELVGLLKEYCGERGKPLVFSSSSKQSAQLLREIYGDEIEISPNTDFFDYCYNRDDLADLIGKKYHSKRNFINRFIKNNWSYEEIDDSNISQCFDLLEQWAEENKNVDASNEGNSDDSLQQEIFASRQGLENFRQLDFIGGIIKVDGNPVAFTFGERLNSDTFNVHAEKALKTYDGSYPMINKEFVSRSCKGYLYINREEDMGEENLRKAKQSYHPVFMEEKFTITFK